MSIPAESITNCDTKKIVNRANLYFYLYTYIIFTICKNLLCVPKWDMHKFSFGRMTTSYSGPLCVSYWNSRIAF